MHNDSLKSFGIFDNHRASSEWDVLHPASLRVEPSKKNSIYVTFDTNVLLDIYRYSDETVNLFREIFNTLKENDQLFITDEVIREFWKLRPQAIERSHAAYDSILGSISKARSYKKTLDDWSTLHQDFLDSSFESAPRTGGDELEATKSRLERLFDSLQSKIDEAKNELPAMNVDKGRDRMEVIAAINSDSIVSLFADSFEGCVGPALADDLRDEYYQKAIEAGKQNRAPGKTDLKSLSRDELGDFLIWQQLLELAASDSREDLKIVLVTNELKLDWWRSTNPKKDNARSTAKRQHMGANLDLIEDYLKVKPDGMIYIWRMTQLIEELEAAYGIHASESQKEEIKNQPAQQTEDEEDFGSIDPATFDPNDSLKVQMLMGAVRVDGYYVIKDGTLSVPVGSKARKEPSRSLKVGFKKKRQQMLEEGFLEISSRDPFHYEFTEQYVFDSAKQAASVISGNNRDTSAWQVVGAGDLSEFLRDHQEAMQ